MTGADPTGFITMKSIQLKSFAKINWTLDVLFRREDSYHELRSIYQSISLHDRLRITDESDSIVVTCNDPRVPCDEANLVHRAAVALREASGSKRGARIAIDKRIPVGAGLGGGSSNGAAALLGLARLWEVNLDESDIIRLAAGLGSDVPLFLIGGTCLGIGRGEEVYPLEEIDCQHLVLVNPGFEVSTREAYQKLSRLTRFRAPRIIPFTLLAAKGVSELPFAARNDLEEVVVAAHPEIADLKRALLELGARHALMSGSGGTVFGVFDNQRSSEAAQEVLRTRGLWCESVRTISRTEYWRTLFE
jgi:4-diphosphocytidyl-2-C-methyl-D-erythritol kinase